MASLNSIDYSPFFSQNSHVFHEAQALISTQGIN